MIESIEFKNFKALRDTTLPLGPLTILIGPNGSGKSTVLQALEAVRTPNSTNIGKIVHFSVRNRKDVESSVKLTWGKYRPPCEWNCRWKSGEGWKSGPVMSNRMDSDTLDKIQNFMARIRVYSLDAKKIAEEYTIQKGNVELASDGAGLPAVLDAMRDDAPEQYKAIESQIGEWLPEFDRILFDRPKPGGKAIALRTKEGQYKVPATDLSQGTLISLALLTLAYQPTPPSLIGLEEPDRGMHPHLLRRIQDSLYRLSHPESCGENREPVQVIATTHSPYFLDLFREHPEEVVVADKSGLDVQFRRLSDEPHIHEYLEDAHLSDVWYSGILGGVPCQP